MYPLQDALYDENWRLVETIPTETIPLWSDESITKQLLDEYDHTILYRSKKQVTVPEHVDVSEVAYAYKCIVRIDE